MYAYDRILLSAKGEVKFAKTLKMRAMPIQVYSTAMIYDYMGC